jgi:uncharacterized protein
MTTFTPVPVRAAAAHLPAPGRLCLCADWREMRFFHYAFDPAVLAPHVPLPLDLYEGRAHVSLVLFHLERMRPWGTGPLGRTCFRAISDHPFLNLRAYVRGPAGPGIHFLAEWISNPLSLHLGPLTYGLPYRRAAFHFETARPGGTDRVCLQGAEGGRASFVLPTRHERLDRAAPGTAEHFLLERYIAYTHRETTRWFCVDHAPWNFHRLDWIRADTELIERSFPWFSLGKLVGAHASPGVCDVRMSLPRRVKTPAEAFAPLLPEPRAAGQG